MQIRCGLRTSALDARLFRLELRYPDRDGIAAPRRSAAGDLRSLALQFRGLRLAPFFRGSLRHLLFQLERGLVARACGRLAAAKCLALRRVGLAEEFMAAGFEHRDEF